MRCDGKLEKDLNPQSQRKSQTTKHIEKSDEFRILQHTVI